MRATATLRCPKCRCGFQVLEDEQFDHGCPRCGYGHGQEQPEHWGTDFYGTEIVEGDEIAIDKGNFEEVVLKDNLNHYLEENVGFRFFEIQGTKVVLDAEKEMVLAEDDLEKYLHEEHGFLFQTAN